jgi:hypothetical protein
MMMTRREDRWLTYAQGRMSLYSLSRVVRARKCVREDRVAEGVPAPRGKSLEV